MQEPSAEPQDSVPDQQPTMNPGPAQAEAAQAIAAPNPPSFEGLPQEIRDEILEVVIFDLSPPEVDLVRAKTFVFPYRHINTNILLVSRNTYQDARGVILRRGRMIMVSATRLHREVFRTSPVPVETLTGWPRITVIHPKYRNLCVMHHRSKCLEVL
jgi:hypothetical protein